MCHNWVSPGWFKTLNDAGYRAIAFDNRGHGASSKSYDPADYHPTRMAGDAAALLVRHRFRDIIGARRLVETRQRVEYRGAHVGPLLALAGQAIAGGVAQRRAFVKLVIVLGHYAVQDRPRAGREQHDIVILRPSR